MMTERFRSIDKTVRSMSHRTKAPLSSLNIENIIESIGAYTGLPTKNGTGIKVLKYNAFKFRLFNSSLLISYLIIFHRKKQFSNFTKLIFYFNKSRKHCNF